MQACENLKQQTADKILGPNTNKLNGLLICNLGPLKIGGPVQPNRPHAHRDGPGFSSPGCSGLAASVLLSAELERGFHNLVCGGGGQ